MTPRPCTWPDGGRGEPDFCRHCGEQIKYRLGTWHHDRSKVVFRAHRPEPDRERERAAGQATKAGQP